MGLELRCRERGERWAAEACGILEHAVAHGFLRGSREGLGYGNELGEKFMGEG